MHPSPSAVVWRGDSEKLTRIKIGVIQAKTGPIPSTAGH